MNKKKIITSLLLVLAIFIFAFKLSNKKVAPPAEKAKQPVKVSVQLASQSNELLQKNQYPGVIVGDQEVKITAKTAGTVIMAPGNIGDRILAGSLLAKIDDVTTLDFGDQGLKSLQIQQAENAVDQAKKSYELAKNNYEALKDSSSATSAQKDSLKTQRDIAKTQYENTKLSLTGSVDNHLITSPISGFIVNKAVSVGDSVSVGQVIATVSQSSNVKIQFFVDQEKRAALKRGQTVSATDNNGNSFAFLIRNIAISADPATKRFLIEAYPIKQDSATLLAGTILNVSIETSSASKNNNLLLPLSAINIGQNESSIFVIEDGKAKKIKVQVIKVDGEFAEIFSSSIAPENQIIFDGSKLISEGEIVTIQD